jgi:hypothetical protein
MLRPTVAASGYQTVGLYRARGAKADTELVHRLVLGCFDGEPTEGQTDGRHLNGNKSDNRLTNLKWGTRSENMLDVIAHRGQQHDLVVTDRPSWYQGYTSDPHILEVGLSFHAAGKLTIADLSVLWKCSRDVASNIVHGETRTFVDRPFSVKKQPRRSKERKDAIRSMVREGKTLVEINQELGESLSHQDLYYYSRKSM